MAAMTARTPITSALPSRSVLTTSVACRQQVFDADDGIVEHLIGALDLRGREAGDARRVAGDVFDVAENRRSSRSMSSTNVVMRRTSCQPATSSTHLQDGGDERRHRDDAEKDRRPGAHASVPGSPPVDVSLRLPDALARLLAEELARLATGRRGIEQRDGRAGHRADQKRQQHRARRSERSSLVDRPLASLRVAGH